MANDITITETPPTPNTEKRTPPTSTGEGSTMDALSTNYSMDEISSVAPMKTIVSFVIDDGESCDINNLDENQKTKCQKKEDKKHARYIYNFARFVLLNGSSFNFFMHIHSQQL